MSYRADPVSPVVFTDTVLEGLVRKAMNKPEGDVTVTEAQAVTQLDLQMEGGVPIARVKDISDLAYFPNLTSLNLNWALYDDGKDIDISVLSGLTKLECLYVACCNTRGHKPARGADWHEGSLDMGQCEDHRYKRSRGHDADGEYCGSRATRLRTLSPLAGMTKLATLYLEGNPITDYSPISGCLPESGWWNEDFTLWPKGLTSAPSAAPQGLAGGRYAPRCRPALYPEPKSPNRYTRRLVHRASPPIFWTDGCWSALAQEDPWRIGRFRRVRFDPSAATS